MLVPILIVMAVSVICVLGGWLLPGLIGKVLRRPGRTASTKPAAAPPARPESLEGVLVAQLITGAITPVQYRRSVEGLAARDDDRNPLSVPPRCRLGRRLTAGSARRRSRPFGTSIQPRDRPDSGGIRVVRGGFHESLHELLGAARPRRRRFVTGGGVGRPCLRSPTACRVKVCRALC
jgi:hypothetical protein